MIDRLEVILARYEEINNDLSDPSIFNDVKRMTELSKEKNSLEEVVSVYKNYKEILKRIEEANELIHDSELGDMAREELNTCQIQKEDLEDKLKILLLPHDPNDEKNVIVEIKGAAGGDEANIFAGDLFDMYQKYANNQGWKIDILNSIEGTAGGFTNIEFMIKGEGVYSKLKYESGAHKVFCF